MAVFLSPGVFPREVDLSVLPAGVGAMRPAFIGTAKKGPLNTPILITTAQQYVETFGEPFPESYLGYAVLAYLEEGSSCYVLRVGVEYREGMDPELAQVAIDTSGSKIQGWGRIPIFRGIDHGKIGLRPINENSPAIFRSAEIAGATNVGSNLELDGVYNSVDGDGTDVTVVFTEWQYTGCDDEIYTITITSDPSGSDPIDGTAYIITDSSGSLVATGALAVGSAGDQSEPIELPELGLEFYLVLNSGSFTENSTIVFQVRPDNRELEVRVDNGTPTSIVMDSGSYSTAQDFVDMVNGVIGTSAQFVAIIGYDENGREIPVLRTDNPGSMIQVTGSCPWCSEAGIPQFRYDIPKSFLLGTETGPYTFSATNSRVVLDVISGEETLQFDFTIPPAVNTPAQSVASVINANGVHQGDRYFSSFALTVPGGTQHVVIITDNNRFDQLRLQANFAFVQTLRFAEELGISFPYTRNFRSFTDNRIQVPNSSVDTQNLPRTCDANDSAYDPMQCALDTAFFENIVGFLVAKYPGTWVNNYRVNLEVFTEGVGDTAGRYKITVVDSAGITQDVIEDITFNPADTRYIGNVVNEGSPLGGVNGNLFYQWESRPDTVDAFPDEVRNPSPFIRRSFIGGQNGIPTDAAVAATQLDRAVIGNPATSTGIYAFQNPESFDFNLLLIPGFSSGPVIAAAIQFCENRGDVLFLVDPPYGLRPQQVISWHNGMLTSDLASAINSSYGALYWSWLRINDLFQGGTIWVPPSGHIAAVFARTERETESWFAPAGLSRGRILSALDIEYNPTQGERDALYGSGNAVNAVVNFTQQGITVWGQRTLQRQATALDRVNVRMLLIFLKKNLTRLLRSFVFEQNDAATRSRITNTLNPFLADIAGRRGLTAYNVVCNESNNTPERIDRNELWVSVFVKPTRVAEFVVLNLVVLRTGANFGAQEVLAAGGVVIN